MRGNRMLLPCAATIMLLATATGPLRADAPDVVVTDATERVTLGRHLEYLIDHDGSLTPQRIASGAVDGRFIPSDEDNPSFGFARAVFWGRLTISSNARRAAEWVLELDYPLMDHFILYETDGRGGHTARETGLLRPMALREFYHRSYAFAITLPPGGRTELLMRFENADRYEFPLVLWSRVAFQRHRILQQFIMGCYYGALLLMSLYSLLLFFSLRERSYLYYVLYIIGMGIVQLTQDGFLFQFFMHRLPAAWHHIVPLTQVLVILPVTQFLQSYLRTAALMPRVNRGINAFKALVTISLALQFVCSYKTAILVNIGNAFALIAIMILCGVVALRKGYRPARYFMVAWSVLAFAAALTMLKNVGVLPYNMLTNYLLHIGTAIELVLLSLGLADRINYANEETERERRTMTESFARFVPREFLELLGRESIVHVGLGDQVEREITVLFSDIRSFTSMSEQMNPQETIDFINGYLKRIGPIIRKNGGFIDKYIGDAVMALFAREAADACSAALDMLDELDRYNEERSRAGKPPIAIGIGIHTGVAMMGTVGEQNRLDTTVISDMVNVASRIEGLTKQLGYPALISQVVRNRIAGRGEFAVQEIGSTPVKGRTAEVVVYAIGRQE